MDTTSETTTTHEKRTTRRPLVYFFLVAVTVLFIFFISTPLNTSWMTVSHLPQLRLIPKSGKDESPIITTAYPIQIPFSSTPSPIPSGFLLYSKNCRIPDINPYHSSIKHLIEITDPLNCSTEYEPLTTSDETTLFVHKSLATDKGINNFTCCYQVLYRSDHEQSDNAYRLSKICKPVNVKAKISEEFIKVECRLSNGSVFYNEFHSFVQDKPEVERRCANSSAKYSVMVIGIDATSRMNMHRQLKNTYDYLKNQMNATEMYGFNKVGDNTFPNLVPLLLGHDERELPSVCWNSSLNNPLDDCDFIWNRFKKMGYRTFYAEDTPYISSFNYQKEGFYSQPTDYYSRSFMLAYEDLLGRNKPLNCHLCVGSVSETEAVLQFTEKFAKHFSNRPYFSFSWINSLSHDFLNMISSGDHMYEKFFRNLHVSGSLNNTFLILMGDHGMRWGEIRSTYIGRLEERLPMLIIVTPQDFSFNYPEAANALRENSHKLVTPFDLYATLENILHLDNDWKSVDTSQVGDNLKDIFRNRSLSIFQHVPEDRSCADASIDEHWCTCEMSLASNPNSTEVKLIALFLVNHINLILKTRSSLCAVLQLEEIRDSRLWHPPNDEPDGSTIQTIVIKTVPGHAIFEATLRTQNNQNHLLGTISRLNLYRDQSSCVHDSILKKYCFCL